MATISLQHHQWQPLTWVCSVRRVEGSVFGHVEALYNGNPVLDLSGLPLAVMEQLLGELGPAVRRGHILAESAAQADEPDQG